MRTTILAALLGALAVSGIALGAAERDTYTLDSKLTAGAEVPKPKNVPAAATGRFTGKAVELANDKARLTWRLTFSHLSGKAIAAHIHLGKKGKAGNVIVPLCAPCRSGMTGKAVISHAIVNKIKAGLTYVNVHTPKNAAGEIRAQLKATED
jgi:CHRD domain-containing protein